MYTIGQPFSMAAYKPFFAMMTRFTQHPVFSRHWRGSDARGLRNLWQEGAQVKVIADSIGWIITIDND